MKIRQSVGDRIFLGIVYAILIFFALMCLYPLYLIIISSFSDPAAVGQGKVLLYPMKLTITAYTEAFRTDEILVGYRNSLFYVLVGTALNLLLTIPAAYSLSHPKVKGKGVVMKLLVFTMYFSGGMIPSYLLVSSLGLRDSMWALIIPNIIHTSNCIIMINGFRATPESLYEAAYLDGAGDFQVFLRIALPLAKATIASLALFYFMSHWNDFFTPMLYLDSADKMPLQVVLRSVLIEENTIEMDPTAGMLTPEGIKGAVIFITMIPVMIVYPVVQRYFVGGVMMGSVKG